MMRFATRLLLLAGMLVPLFALAQTRPSSGAREPVKLIIKDVEFDASVTPEYSVKVRGGTRSGGRKQWLELTVEYETAPKWIDELNVTFHVMLKGDPDDVPNAREEKDLFNMFSGDVSFINVARGKHRATMFLEPSTFARYGDVQAVTAIISMDGKEVAMKTTPRNLEGQKWWEGRSSNSVSLMNRSETPWKFVEIDVHETIKP